MTNKKQYMKSSPTMPCICRPRRYISLFIDILRIRKGPSAVIIITVLILLPLLLQYLAGLLEEKVCCAGTCAAQTGQR